MSDNVRAAVMENVGAALVLIGAGIGAYSWFYWGTMGGIAGLVVVSLGVVLIAIGQSLGGGPERVVEGDDEYRFDGGRP